MFPPLVGTATAQPERLVVAIEMPDEETTTERTGYGDAEVQQIIERAALIDAEQGRRLDAPALRTRDADAALTDR